MEDKIRRPKNCKSRPPFIALKAEPGPAIGSWKSSMAKYSAKALDTDLRRVQSKLQTASWAAMHIADYVLHPKVDQEKRKEQRKLAKESLEGMACALQIAQSDLSLIRTANMMPFVPLVGASQVDAAKWRKKLDPAREVHGTIKPAVIKAMKASTKMDEALASIANPSAAKKIRLGDLAAAAGAGAGDGNQKVFFRRSPRGNRGGHGGFQSPRRASFSRGRGGFRGRGGRGNRGRGQS